MTTIAVKDGVMAADSRTTAHGYFAGKTTKIHRLPNKALLGCAGDVDVREIVKLMSTCTPKNMPSRSELAATKTDFAGLILFPNGSLFSVAAGMVPPCDGAPPDWYGEVMECKERFAAVGSGEHFAMGAMAAGRSAKAAVEIACRYDTASGPPVIEVPLKPLPKTPIKRVKKRRA